MKQKTPPRTVLVMGLGLHGGGASAANYFDALGDRVIVTDLKTREQLASGLEKLKNPERVQLVLGTHRYEDFKKADLVIKNPGVPRSSPYLACARENNAAVDTDLGVFVDRVRELNVEVIGVTGTKGKSTTAALIHAMAETQQPGALLGGNITIPVLDIIDRLSPGSRVILELSSFQLGDLEHKQYSPRVAVLTNFMEDHLDYYRGMEEYFRDKSLIYRYQTRGDRLVVNRDDSVLDLVLSSGGRVTDTFGAGGPMNGFGTFLRDSTVWCRGQEGEYPLLPVGEFPLPGRHNLYNLLCAAAAARSAGIAPDAVRTAAAGFKGLGHRMEFLGSWRGIRIYNDSAATTPDAAAAAIESLEGPLTVIAGGADKNLPLGRFAAALKEKVHALVLLEGSGTTRLLQQEPGLDASCHDTIDSALGRALEMAAPGGAVVLSPGFASFGLFRNEFDRGDRFREAVRKLTEKEIP